MRSGVGKLFTRTQKAMKRIATLLAVLTAATPAVAQSWPDAFAAAVPAGAEALSLDEVDPLTWPAYKMYEPCGYAIPDSLALLSGSQAPGGSSVTVPYRTTDGEQERGVVIRPTGVNEIHARLVDHRCDNGRVSAIILEASGQPLFIEGGRYAILRAIQPDGSMVEMEYDHRVGRTATADAMVELRTEAESQAEAAAERYRQELRSRGWTAQTVADVLNGRVRIGMTAGMVRESWGNPSHINRTTTALGVREQWVYKGRSYIYFDNGVVSAMQTSQ